MRRKRISSPRSRNPLEEENLQETLEQFAQEATEAQKEAENDGESESEITSESQEESLANAESQSPSPGESESQGQSKGEGKSKGKGKGSGQGSGQGEGGSEPGEQLADASGSDPSETGDSDGESPQGGEVEGAEPGNVPQGGDKPSGDTSAEKLADRAREAETIEDVLKFFAGDGSAETGEGEGDEDRRERFNAIREANGTDTLADDLRRLAEQRAGGGAADEALASDLSERLDRLSKQLAAEQRRLVESKLEQLAEAQAKARELNEQSQQASANAIPEAFRNLELPPEILDQLAQSNGQSPGSGSTGGGAGAPSNSSGIEELARDLESFNDEQLGRIAQRLSPKDPGRPPDRDALAEAEKRLAELIAEIIGQEYVDAAGDNIPREYERTVEDYFRALSDDFGNETWDK